MLSSWFGLEPIPICSIDLAPLQRLGQSPNPIHRPSFGSCRPDTGGIRTRKARRAGRPPGRPVLCEARGPAVSDRAGH